MAQRKSQSERVYGMLESGKSDAFILRATEISKGTLTAYKANLRRREKMGAPRRNGPDSTGIQNIVVDCLNANIPNESIYADPRLRGVGPQRIAGFIAAYNRGAYDK